MEEMLQLRSLHDIERWKEQLIDLYKKAFSESPYFEFFTDDEVLVIIKEIVLNRKGIFVVMLHNGNVVGLCGGYCLVYEQTICQLFKLNNVFEQFQKIIYLAELAVDSNYRRKGFGSKLVDYFAKLCKIGKFTTITTRTQADLSNSLELFQKKQFEIVQNVFQDVETCMNTEQDKIVKVRQKRCFLKKHL